MKFWRRWDWVVLRILLKDVSSEIFQLVFKHLVYVQLKPVNKYKIFRSFHQCTCYITRWHCFGCSYYVLLRTDAWQNLSLALAKKRLFYVWVVKHASQKTQIVIKYKTCFETFPQRKQDDHLNTKIILTSNQTEFSFLHDDYNFPASLVDIFMGERVCFNLP